MANEEALAEVMPTEELESESKDSTKGLSMTLKLVIAGIGGLTTHGLLAYYLATSFVIPVYFSASSDNATVIEEQVVKAVKPAQVTSTAASSPVTDNSGPKNIDESEYVSIRHIVVNPYGTNGRRFLAMDMSIGVNNRSAVRELKNKDAQLRDRINTFLSRKTVAELTNVVSKRKIKKDIIALLNRMLERGEVTEIYFTKYVLQ